MRKITDQSEKYCENFAEFLTLIKKFGDRQALTWYSRKGEKNTRTYNEFVSDVISLRNALIQLGLAGRHLAVVGENSYEWLLVYFAAVSCGAVAVCIDAEQSEETIRNMVDWADSEVVFMSDSCAEIFREEEKTVFRLDHFDEIWISVGEIAESGDGEGEDPADECPNLSGDQIASIVYTSGTTNLAKPVMLSQRALLINAAESNRAADIGARVFSALPFCHTYAMTCAVTATLLRGAELVFNGDMRTAMRDMKLSRAYSLLTVPLIIETLYQQIINKAEQAGKAKELKKALMYQSIKRKIGLKSIPSGLTDIKEELLGSIELIICGGAYLDYEIAENLNLMGIRILEGYGITECSPLVSVNSKDDIHFRTVGCPLPCCKVRIKDGEIQVSGPCIMKGYYKMEKETEKVLKNGWFCTGDLGEFDKDGYLRITGRRKNLIVFKNGKKVSPEIYEQKLRQIPIVGDVIVYGASAGGTKDDVKIAASIYPDQDMTRDMTSYEILESLQREIDILNNTLPFYQQIQMLNIREEEFDRNTLRKIRRHAE